MIVLAFDLSSVCIGVFVAEIRSDKVLKASSCPIIPPKFNVEELGFKKTKVNNCYIKYKDEVVSKTEKKRRDTLVRRSKNDFIKKKISEDITNIVTNISPDLILAERNQIFNGVLTSVLLGEIMGVLEGIAGGLSIPLEKYSVQEVRKDLNVSKLVKEFSKIHDVTKYKDVTKAAIAEVMSERYDIEFSTCDESDACVVFDYWMRRGRGK